MDDGNVKELRFMAQQTANAARDWRTAFRRAAWCFVATSVLFIPSGLAFVFIALNERSMLTGACGGLIFGLGLIGLQNARGAFRTAEEAFTNFMDVRQNCLDAIKELEDL